MTLREWLNEHPWPSVLAAGLVVALVGLAGLHWRLTRLRDDLRRADLQVSRVRRMARRHAALRAELPVVGLAGSAALKEGDVDRIAREKGVFAHINTTSGRPVIHEEGLKEHVVKVTLTGVRRKELSAFLNAVEALSPTIRTKQMRIAANRRAPKLVDASVEFSCYEAAAVQPK